MRIEKINNERYRIRSIGTFQQELNRYFITRKNKIYCPKCGHSVVFNNPVKEICGWCGITIYNINTERGKRAKFKDYLEKAQMKNLEKEKTNELKNKQNKN